MARCVSMERSQRVHTRVHTLCFYGAVTEGPHAGPHAVGSLGPPWFHMVSHTACAGLKYGLAYRLRGSRIMSRSRGEAEESCSWASCAAGARGWPVCFAGRANMLAGQSGLRVRAPVARKQVRRARPRHASRRPGGLTMLSEKVSFQ